MENRDFILFFFIFSYIISCIVYTINFLKLQDKNRELENYLDDLHNELAKLRKK